MYSARHNYFPQSMELVVKMIRAEFLLVEHLHLHQVCNLRTHQHHRQCLTKDAAHPGSICDQCWCHGLAGNDITWNVPERYNDVAGLRWH